LGLHNLLDVSGGATATSDMSL